jgi:hypothetical protein
VESPNLVKVVAAFVAGVVIALGSALIYVRASEMMHPEPIVLAQAPADAPQPPPTRLPETVQQPASSAVTAPPSEPVPIPRAKKVVKWLFHRQVKSAPGPKAQPKIAMAQLAQTSHIPVAVPATYTVQEPGATPGDSVPVPEAKPAPQPADTAPEPSPVRQPHIVTLQAGTVLAIRLAEPLSTDHNYTGDTFRGTLAAPIIRDGFIIADRASKVLGRVVSSERGGRMQGSADLNVTLTQINTTDGQQIRVDTTSFEQRGPASAGEDAATIAGGAALGAIIGAAAGGGKGAAIGAGLGGAAGTGAVFASRSRPAMLPVETQLTFRLATPLTITEKLN